MTEQEAANTRVTKAAKVWHHARGQVLEARRMLDFALDAEQMAIGEMIEAEDAWRMFLVRNSVQ